MKEETKGQLKRDLPPSLKNSAQPKSPRDKHNLPQECSTTSQGRQQHGTPMTGALDSQNRQLEYPRAPTNRYVTTHVALLQKRKFRYRLTTRNPYIIPCYAIPHSSVPCSTWLADPPQWTYQLICRCRHSHSNRPSSKPFLQTMWQQRIQRLSPSRTTSVHMVHME